MKWLILVLFRLVMLHGPGGQIIWINPEAVVELRTPREGEHFPPGTRCVINTSDGKFALVVESCKDVEEMMK
jgi:hypothetical protein